MKIIHILDNMSFYGATSMVYELARSQSKHEHTTEVIFLASDSSSTQQPTVPKTFELAHIRTSRFELRRIPTPIDAFRLNRRLQVLEADIVHCHGYKGCILLAMNVFRRSQLTLIRTLHGYTAVQDNPRLKFYYLLDQLAMGRMNKIAVVSEACKQQLPPHIRHRAYVVPNGIQREAEASSSNYFGGHGQVVFSIGRLAPEKNYSSLLSAFARIVKSRAGVQLVIAGDGPLMSDLEDQIDALGIRDSVSLPGFIQDPAALLSSIDVYVNCSTTEGMPMSLLEVLRLGRRIVASDIPANRELLGEEKLGLLFEPKNVAQLESRLLESLSLSEKETACLESRQRSAFLRQYTADVMATNYYHLYQ